MPRAFAPCAPPLLDGGQPRGRRIDATSVAVALGFTTYDELKSVGDRDVRSADDPARELQDQADRPEIAVVVSRLGEPTILRYRVVSSRVDEDDFAAAAAAWDKAEQGRMVARSAAGPGTSGDTPVPAPHAGVVPAAGENTYEVDQAALRHFLDNSADRSARIVRR